MTTDQHLEMHQQHREAAAEIESWVDDLHMWRAEHKQALAWLTQIEAAIQQYEVKLQQHSSVIDKLERHIRLHEHEIAVQEQKGESRGDTPLAEQHAYFNASHSQARDEHARIAEHHRSQIANLHRLKEQFLAASQLNS